MSFSEAQVQRVWEKGTIVPNYNPNDIRQDVCKAWVARNAYGDINSRLGWEIDHIDPNGGDDISNLQPLQWQNNRAKANNLKWECVATSSGNQNVSVK